MICGDYSYARYADYIENVFELYGKPQDSLIADLGCGTGSLCVELAARGYDMIGIDGSHEMLGKAYEKAAKKGISDILFLEQEMDGFDLFGTVGAFVSTIDSMNYIIEKRRLQRLFKLVENYLSPGGLFIFDMNTIYKLAKVIGNKVFYEVSEDLCCLWDNRYNGANRTAAFDLTLFTREGDGRWRRHDETQRQRAYAHGEIEAAARRANLRIIGAYSFLTFDKPKRNTEKINYILKKPRTTGDARSG